MVISIQIKNFALLRRGIMQDKNLMFVWNKTLLSVYRYIDTVIKAIDNLVLKQALNSGFYYSAYFNSTFNCVNKIIDLTARKQRLLGTKILLDDALNKLSNDDVRLLMLIYVDMVKSSDIAKNFNISIRTFFRKKRLAINKLANILKALGFNSPKLKEHLQGEGWLINLFNKNLENFNLENGADNSDVLSSVNQYKLLKYIMKDLNSTPQKVVSY